MEDCKTELKILKGAEKEKLANLILEEMYKLYIRNYKGLKLTGGKVSELMELWEKRTRKPFTILRAESPRSEAASAERL
jgi:hypothetical protein